MVHIVESGKTFSTDDILWLNGLMQQVSAPSAPVASAPAAPVEIPLAPAVDTTPVSMCSDCSAKIGQASRSNPGSGAGDDAAFVMGGSLAVIGDGDCAAQPVDKSHHPEYSHTLFEMTHRKGET